MAEKKRVKRKTRKASAKRRLSTSAGRKKAPARTENLKGQIRETESPKKARAEKPEGLPSPVVRSPALQPQAATEAPPKPCLPRPQAVLLVRSCGTDDFPLSTRLGDLFPDPNRRLQFCQCVANGVPIDRSEIPCTAGTTLQQVVDAISCD